MHVSVQRNPFRDYLFFLLSVTRLLLALLVEEHPLQFVFPPGISSKQGLTSMPLFAYNSVQLF